MMFEAPGPTSQGSAVPLTLGRLVALPEHQAALLAIQQILQGLRDSRQHAFGNPLFVHGPPGCGKSLLVKAFIDEVVRVVPGWSITLLAARDLSRGPVDAVESEPAPDDVRSEAGHADLLAIEDLQQLPASAAERLVQLFDVHQARQKPMIFTATAGPGQLTDLPRRLTSRLASGLVVRIASLSAASRFAVLHDHAQRRQLAVKRDVLLWLADHLRGGRQLDGALNRLESLLRQGHEPLDVATVAGYFREDIESAHPTVERIAHRVSNYFDVPERQLQSRRRAKRMLLPRQVSMYLARRLTALSLNDIGRYFGGRDHTTVLHACRKVERSMQSDAVVAGAVWQLEAELV